MSRLRSFLRLALLTLVVAAGSIAAPRPAEATHFRYGHLTWRKARGNAVQFTLTAAFERSGYLGTAPDGFLAVGDVFNENIGGTGLEFGDGTRVGDGFNGLRFVVVAIDPVRDYAIARALDPNTGRDRIDHLYGQPSNGGNPWVARVESCCRISTLNNNPDGDYRVATEIDLRRNSFSAVSSLPAIIPVPRSGTQFPIPGIDNDRDQTLRFRLATSDEAGPSQGFVQPPGVTIDPVTGVYTIPAGLTTGLWTSQVIIEELDANGTQVGQVALDFIFQVLDQVTTNPPDFDRPPTLPTGTDLIVTPGSLVSYQVQATDPDGDAVVLNTTGIPLAARQFPALPLQARSPVVNFNWTPTLDDVGVYSITYTAEDGNGNQTFTSINICVIPPLSIFEPNGGEAYLPGERVEITWDTVGCPRPSGVRIELSRDGGQTFPEVLAAATLDDGLFVWTAALPRTANARIRIISLDDPTDRDTSDGNFTIVGGENEKVCTAGRPTGIPDNEPAWTAIPIPYQYDLIIRGLFVYVKATHPFIGDLEVEVVHPNSAARIAQGLQPNPEDVVLLHDESGEGDDDINTTYGAGRAVTPPKESLVKLYGRPSRGTWYLRVRDLKPGDVGTLDQWCVQVIGPRRGEIAVTSPKPADRLAVGLPTAITWTEKDVQGFVVVDLSRDGGQTYTRIANVAAGVRKFNWTVTGPPTENARFRVQSVDEPAIVGETAGDVIIRNPSLKVLQPNGDEIVSSARIYEIRWEDTPTAGTVSIELSRDGGRTYTPITNSTPDTGLYLWTPAANLDTTQARIRIRANSGPARSDVSDRNFTIQTPSVRVTAPAGGDVWYVGDAHEVRWSTVGVEGPVRLELFRNGRWENLLNSTPNDGQETVTVQGAAALDARIRVTAASDSNLSAASETFTLRRKTISLLDPNGGQVFAVGSQQTVRFSTDGYQGQVFFDLSTDGGRTWVQQTGTPTNNEFAWTVPAAATTRALIRVRGSSAELFDVSDRPFTIVTPSLQVTTPRPGDVLRTGQRVNLAWKSTAVTGRVKIELSRDGGDTWETLFETTANDGTESWTVTGAETQEALLRITAAEMAQTVQDVTDDTFEIVTPTLTVTAANGAEEWVVDTAREITWDSENLGGSVKVELTRNGGQTWETLFGSVPNNGKVTWRVTGPGTGSARVRVSSLTDASATDESDGPFTIIQPSLAVGRPNGGEQWLVGSAQTITWGSAGVSGKVHVELSRDGGSTWTRLFSATDNDGVQPWTVTGPGTERARVRVISVDRASVQDTSDRNFSILAPSLRVTSPAAGDRWRVGRRYSITWTGSVVGAGGSVEIQLSRNGGRTFSTLIPETDNDGSVQYQVTGRPAQQARIRVIWKPSPNVRGDSGVFRIKKAR